MVFILSEVISSSLTDLEPYGTWPIRQRFRPEWTDELASRDAAAMSKV